MLIQMGVLAVVALGATLERKKLLGPVAYPCLAAGLAVLVAPLFSV